MMAMIMVNKGVDKEKMWLRKKEEEEERGGEAGRGHWAKERSGAQDERGSLCVARFSPNRVQVCIQVVSN